MTTTPTMDPLLMDTRQDQHTLDHSTQTRMVRHKSASASAEPASPIEDVVASVHRQRITATTAATSSVSFHCGNEVLTWSMYAILHHHGFSYVSEFGLESASGTLLVKDVFTSSVHSMRLAHRPDYDAFFVIKCVPIGSQMMITAKVVITFMFFNKIKTTLKYCHAISYVFYV
jgi:hypothetical protein